MTQVTDNVVFYDGDCALCNSTVQFLLRHNTEVRFYFAPINGITYEKLIPQESSFRSVDSILLLSKGHIYCKSNAVLSILVEIGGWLHAVKLLYIFPKFIRDAVYDWISKSRYQIFGKVRSCTIPDKTSRNYLLP